MSEVFAGNTQDASTVPDKIAQLQRQYGLKELIFVGDRGMMTQAVADKVKAPKAKAPKACIPSRP